MSRQGKSERFVLAMFRFDKDPQAKTSFTDMNPSEKQLIASLVHVSQKEQPIVFWIFASVSICFAALFLVFVIRDVYHRFSN